jgi:hypothetical protein
LEEEEWCEAVDVLGRPKKEDEDRVYVGLDA